MKLELNKWYKSKGDFSYKVYHIEKYGEEFIYSYFFTQPSGEEIFYDQDCISGEEFFITSRRIIIETPLQEKYKQYIKKNGDTEVIFDVNVKHMKDMWIIGNYAYFQLRQETDCIDHLRVIVNIKDFLDTLSINDVEIEDDTLNVKAFLALWKEKPNE